MVPMFALTMVFLAARRDPEPRCGSKGGFCVIRQSKPQLGRCRKVVFPFGPFPHDGEGYEDLAPQGLSRSWKGVRARPAGEAATPTQLRLGSKLPSLRNPPPSGGGGSAQPRQRRFEPLGLRGVVSVVGAGFFDRFGLGFFDEGRVVEAFGEGVAFLERYFACLGEAGLFGGDVDYAFAGADQGVASARGLRGGAGGRFGHLARGEPRQPPDRRRAALVHAPR